jgi:uncharacterized protein YbjQ (UPF0145 family)
MSESPFVSTLSVGGFITLADAGFRPLQQVQGTCVMSLGYQKKPSRHLRGALAPQVIEGSRATSGMSSTVYVPRGALTVQQYLNEGGSFELEERTAAYNDARETALARLGAAAREAGAIAVVDVRIGRGLFGHAQHAIEFTALGTAVTSDRFEPREEDPVPLVSISGSEFWELVETGVWPLGIVGGTSVNYVVSGYRTKFARFRLSRRSYRNQEYMDYTDGFRLTRLHATSRMRREATKLGATGILGISVDRTLEQQRDDDLLVTVDVLGTAVAPLESGAPPSIAYALGVDKT